MKKNILLDTVTVSRPVINLDLDESISEEDIQELESVLELELGEKIVLKITDDIDTGF